MDPNPGAAAFVAEDFNHVEPTREMADQVQSKRHSAADEGHLSTCNLP